MESQEVSCPIADPMKTDFNRGALLHYLRSCLMPGGGFCSFRDPESGAGFANVADTFLALSSFKILGENPPGLSNTKDWLSKTLESNRMLGKSPFLTWAISAKVLLDMTVSLDEKESLRSETKNLLREDPSDDDLPSLLQELAFIYRLRLSLDLSSDETERRLLTGFLDRVSFRAHDPTILELQDRVSLSGLISDHDAECSVEKDYRHPILGYVLVPGSSRSDLNILLSGLRLRQEPITSDEADSLRVRILFCQERSGGFGPVGGAVPTLESTYTALEILKIIAPIQK